MCRYAHHGEDHVKNGECGGPWRRSAAVAETKGGEGGRRETQRKTCRIVIVHLFALYVLGPASPRGSFPESAGWVHRHSGSSMRSCESPAISFDDWGIEWLSQSGPDTGLDFGVDQVSDYPGVRAEINPFFVGSAPRRSPFLRRRREIPGSSTIIAWVW